MKFNFSILLALVLCITSKVCAMTATDAVSSMVSGHNVYVGKNTSDGTLWKYELLKNAKKTIEMSCGYTSGEVFSNVYQIIKKQLETNPDIQIRFMVSQYAGLFSSANQDLLKNLQNSYPKNFQYQITGLSYQVIDGHGLHSTENHTKIIIVDEKYCILGGTNLSDNLSHQELSKDYEAPTLVEAFLSEGANDQDVVFSGPMVKKLRKEFFQIYEIYKTSASVNCNEEPFCAVTDYQPVLTKDKAIIACFDNHPDLVRNIKAFATISGPRFNHRLIGDLYEHYIKSAQSSIELAHMYFFPVDEIYQALIDAVNRDVQLSLITNAYCLRAKPANMATILYSFINRVNYLPLMMGETFHFWQKYEIEKISPKSTLIYEYARQHVLFHKKVLIVDDHYSTVGSYNLGSKSQYADYEVNIFMDSPSVAIKLHDNLTEDKKSSECVSLQKAMEYYFSIYYNLVKSFESAFFDGTYLSVDDLPKEVKDKVRIDLPDLDL